MKSEKQVKDKMHELLEQRNHNWKMAEAADKKRTKDGRIMRDYCRDVASALDKQVMILKWVLK